MPHAECQTCGVPCRPVQSPPLCTRCRRRADVLRSSAPHRLRAPRGQLTDDELAAFRALVARREPLMPKREREFGRRLVVSEYRAVG